MVSKILSSCTKYCRIIFRNHEYLKILSSIAMIVTFLKSIFKIPKILKTSSSTPLASPKFKKLIFLVIDGLRFDAFVPVNKDGLYYNNFSFTKDESKLRTTFLSVSGIPTVTTCRIIGMMTGTPSNQIEELLTFFTSSINTDALPDKFTDRKMFFYGDDVWKHSFKALKKKSCTIHGLSKKDLDLNEAKLIEEIKNDLESEIKFIHIISLDALGHSYGTNHINIQKALKRADDLVNHLYRNMDDDTLLVVTSDHGVTNEGAHGGNSKFEMASTCGFYSKKINILQNYDSNVYNTNFISKFYDLSFVNTDMDFISAKNPYKIIHQDDILPTVAYLMGVPTPTNTYGNLIPYLVSDFSAQFILLNQKQKLIVKPISVDSTLDLTIQNYELTNEIYRQMTAKRYIYVAVCILLSFYCIFSSKIDLILFSKDKKGIFAYVISTILVSHSYYSFASEDLVWFSAFLTTNFSISNLIFFIYYLKTPGRNFFESDRIDIGMPKYENPIKSFLTVLMFVFFKMVNTKGNRFSLYLNTKFLNNILKILPQILFLLYSYCEDVSFSDKMTFGITYPSIDTLLVIHFNPLIALNFIFFIRNIDLNGKLSTKYILLSLTPYLLNLEKVIQSIDYDVFSAYSHDFGSLSNFTGFLSYTLIPPIYIHNLFDIQDTGFILNFFSLLVCFVCTWFLHGTLVYQYFFVSRLFFVIFSFLIDLIILEMIKFIRSSKNKKIANK